jgi:hypothetical protein
MLLAAIIIILLVLVGHVRAEPLTTRTFKDSMGREIGRSTTHGNTTTFRDSMGRETGRAVRSGNGTTFYDNFGRETGRSLKVGQCPSGFMQSGAYCIDTRRR